MSVPPPIFILASPRSFTSLICAMLGQHPEAYGVPELNLFVTETLGQLTQRMRGFRQFMMHGLLRTVAQLYTGEQTMLSVETAYRWILSRSHCPTGEVYRELCRKVSPLRVVDKSPVYSSKSEYLNRIRQAFPEAQYLYLVRHPRTQGKSALQVRGGALAAVLAKSVDYDTSPPTIDPQYAWYEMQRTILDFLSTVPASQQLYLRGEDVLNEPHLYLETICRWLNLTWNEAALAAMLRPQDSPYACPGPYGAHLGNDPNFLKSPALRATKIACSQLDGSLPWRRDNKSFTPEVVKLAQALGYE